MFRVKFNNLNYYIKNNYRNFSYISNFFLPTFIFMLLFLSGNQNYSIDASIIISLNQVLIFSLSAHRRNYILGFNKSRNILNIISLRIWISIILFIINLFFLKNIKILTEFNNFYILILVLIFISWIKEISLSYLQIKSIEYQKIFIFDVLLITSATFIIFINLYLFFFILTLIVLNKTFFVIYSIIRIKNHYKNEQLSSNVENKVSIYYLSSFLVAITNLILRLSISNDLSTEMASTLIFCFSLASMPSTLYLNSIGINILIYRKFFPTYFKIIIYIYTIIFLYSY